MQIVRTIAWVLLLAALLLFSINNWTPVEVKIWEGLVLETKLPALVVIAFLLGLIPMWMVHRATKWHLHRRVNSLEAAARAAALATERQEVSAPVSSGVNSGVSSGTTFGATSSPTSSFTAANPAAPQAPVTSRSAGVDEFGPRGG